MNTFDCIILDMDGLMVDTEHLYWSAARDIAASFSKTVTDDTLRKMMGRGPLQSMQVFADDLGLAEPAESLLAARTARMLDLFSRGVDPMPGLVDFLGAFHGRVKLAVATSSPSQFTRLILPRMNLERYFDIIQTSDGLTHFKPHPEIYLRAIERLGTTPARAIVLEDSAAGALSGKNAGAYVIAVPNRHTEMQDFSFADFRAQDLTAARDHIAALITTP